MALSIHSTKFDFTKLHMPTSNAHQTYPVYGVNLCLKLV